VLALLVMIGPAVELRSVFPSASPLLYGLLTFGLGTGGFWVPVVAGGLLGALSALIDHVPPLVRRPIVWAFGMLLGLGLFAGLLRTPMLTLLGGSLAGIARFLFG